MSPSVYTVPLVETRMFEVASSPVEPHTAMSPAPMSTSEPDGGGGVTTVTVDVPVWPPAAARIDAVPAAMPRTSPDVETVATAVLDELHVNVVADPRGVAVAVSCTVAPASTVALDGDTEIDFSLFAAPPLASEGASVSLARGADVSEHATSAKVTPATTTAVAVPTMVRLCMTLSRESVKVL